MLSVTWLIRRRLRQLPSGQVWTNDMTLQYDQLQFSAEPGHFLCSGNNPEPTTLIFDQYHESWVEFQDPTVVNSTDEFVERSLLVTRSFVATTG